MTIKLAFAVTEVGPEAAAGDYFTALELGTALQARLGWCVEYRSKSEGSEWYDLTDVDVLVVMVWEYELPAIRNSPPHLLTIAWARSGFDFWCDRPWIADYDLHLASSRSAADFMSKRNGKLTRLLRIATNPARFNTEKRPINPTLDYVFTGHYWQAERDIVDALSALPTHYRGAIYGKHWEQVTALTHLHRGFVPYGQIHEVYQQAVIVIDDSNHVSKKWGAANSRCFDALAAGCLVITNSRSVSDDAFDGLLPVYESPVELANLLDRYLNDTDERTCLLNNLRGKVLAGQCYTHRAIELKLYLDSLHKLGIPLIAARASRDMSFPPLSRQELPKHQVLPSTPEHLPSVSFVVPLFNHFDETREMLASFEASLPEKLDYEIILVDDASTDGTGDWLKSLRDPHIKVLISDTNRGYAATNNAGVRQATGELLCLLNNDLLFDPGWLEPMLAILLSPHMKAGLVGNVQYRVADGTVDHVQVNLSPEGQFQHIRNLPSTPHVKALAVTGACMLLRKSDFDAVGGFDEKFINGAEDYDLCYKLRAMGKSIRVATNSIVQHHVSLSRKRNTDQDIRNSQYLFSRWGKEIKRDLINTWRRMLGNDPNSYKMYISGGLSPELVESPNVLSNLIAQMMIDREKAEWVRRLNDCPKVTPQPIEVTWRGLSFDMSMRQHVLTEEAEFVVKIGYASNFYICGAVANFHVEQVEVEINVNNIQRLKITLDRPHEVNAGIVGPLILPGIKNVFRVRTTTPLILTHIVINDQRLDV